MRFTEGMRRCAIGAVVAILCASPARAANGTAPAGITVNGEAEILVAPDEVVLTLGVETKDLDLRKSAEENSTRVKKVIAVVESLGIESSRIQTAHMSIEPVYQYEHTTSETLDGYRSRKTIVVRIGDIGKLESVIKAALENGTNRIHGVQFRTTEPRKHLDKARALAIKAAREKAVDMAAELGHSVGDPESIREGYSGWSSWGGQSWWGPGGWRGGYSNSRSMEGTSSPSHEGSIAPGMISMKANVTVTFKLKPAPE